MSSKIFLVVNSPVHARVERGKDRKQVPTRFSFCDDDTTTLQDCFEFVQVEITVSRSSCGACRYDGFLYGKLDNERLCDESDLIAKY